MSTQQLESTDTNEPQFPIGDDGRFTICTRVLQGPDQWRLEPVTITSVGIVPWVRTDIFPEPSVLLTRVIDGPTFSWENPAGRVEPTDRSPCSAAKRELREETGLIAKISPGNILGAIPYVRGDGTDRCALCFVVKIQLPEIDRWSSDKWGRLYFKLFPGAHLDEVDQLALEPWSLFISRESLTRDGRHPDPQKGVIRMLRLGFTPR